MDADAIVDQTDCSTRYETCHSIGIVPIEAVASSAINKFEQTRNFKKTNNKKIIYPANEMILNPKSETPKNALLTTNGKVLNIG